jgi:outer membrane protein assembly factor BamE (lipoprotein component of BamABCDE complex)
MAAKQPSKKNLDVMSVGTPRSLVLAEFGQPTVTETREGKKVDVFSFVQGYSKGAKTGRAVFHGVADVFTFGLWEVVGTPTEAVFDGTKVTYEITYDENNRVEKVVPLTEKSKEEAPKEIAEPLPKSEADAQK